MVIPHCDVERLDRLAELSISTERWKGGRDHTRPRVRVERKVVLEALHGWSGSWERNIQSKTTIASDDSRRIHTNLLKRLNVCFEAISCRLGMVAGMAGMVPHFGRSSH